MRAQRYLPLGLGLVAVAAIAFAGWPLLQLRSEVASLGGEIAAARSEATVLANEVTRFRIEQRAEGRGPAALLEKLAYYAEAMATARTSDADCAVARQEMGAVLRAFESLGQDGWLPVVRRFDELRPDKAFPEMRWLMEAAVRCDAKKGNELVAQVLAGARKPNPRLRWAAADLLLRTDREQAQLGLRRILLTETSRGIDPDRAAAQGVPILDPAAIANSGFHNFVLHYLRSEDPETEETLLMVLARVEQDVVTLQETIEALGRLKSQRAAKRIEQLYLHPPGAQQNPIFLNKCLDALAAIRGADAREFLEQQLAHAEHELVVAHIDSLLKNLK
jgi:hypothetical protein